MWLSKNRNIPVRMEVSFRATDTQARAFAGRFFMSIADIDSTDIRVEIPR